MNSKSVAVAGSIFGGRRNGVQNRRASGSRSWAEAEERKRELEDQLAARTVAAAKTGQLIEEAVKIFIQDKTVQGVTSDVIKKYTLELRRLIEYCERKCVFTVDGKTALTTWS